MEITEVRIFPTQSKDGKLKAFATMTFDDWFVVRNVKVIQGNNGLFVAMPSRKAMEACPKCHYKNVVGSRYCNQCGAEIPKTPVVAQKENDPHSTHMDIAHPITQECRIYIQDKILAAYKSETGQAEGTAGRETSPEEKKEETPEDTVTGSAGAGEDIAVPEDSKDIAL
jgi:stage V sporulation protein G